MCMVRMVGDLSPSISEFLADTGLPLAQCHQNYQAMDLPLRQDLVPR